MKSDDILLRLLMPEALYVRLSRAAKACGEPLHLFILNRLGSSIP